MLNAPTPEKTRVCPNCSDPELGLKDKFCSSCGTAVSMVVVEEQVEEEASVQDSQPEETEQVAEDEEKEEEEVVRVQSKEGSIEKVVRVIRIVRQNIGRVIGVGGENINEVQDVSGAKIDVDDGEDEMNKITITGTEESVNQAVSMVKQLATGRRKARSSQNESEDRRQKRKPPKEYDETAELFGLNPYKRAGGRGRGMGNFRETREPPFMGSREPPFMGSREPPFMGSREPPFMGSMESNRERAKWGVGGVPDRRGGMSREEYFNSQPEGRFENDLPPWARKSFRAEPDGWNARSRPPRAGGFYRGRDFDGGRDMGGDDFTETRGWGGPLKSDDWVTTTRDTGGWGKSKPEPDTDDLELPKPKPKKYKRDEVAELFGIRQPPPDGRRRWAPYRREALGRGRWASR